MAANDAVSMNVAENRQNVPMAIQENRAAVPMTVAEGGGTPGGLNRKADKVTGAAAGNLAGLDSTGNLTDSGKAPEDFLEAPASAGTQGQVLTADGEGGASWQDPTGGDPTEIIDDNAGSGDTDKVWSADKSHELLTEITYSTPERFGAKGDGVTDDSQAVQEAIDAGYEVRFEDNKTYYLASEVTINHDCHLIGGKNTVIKTLKPSGGSYYNAFTVSGTLKKTTTLTTDYTTVGNTENSGNRFTLTDMDGINIGDIMVITATDQYYSLARDNYYLGATLLISEIYDGHLYTADLMPWNVENTNDVSVAIYEAPTAIIENLSFESVYDGVGAYKYFISLKYCKNSIVKNCTMTQMPNGVQIYYCVNTLIDCVNVSKAKYDNTIFNDSYGIEINSCTDTIVQRVIGICAQHCITTGGFIPVLNTYIRNCNLASECRDPAIGMHENAYNTVVEDCTLFGASFAGTVIVNRCQFRKNMRVNAASVFVYNGSHNPDFATLKVTNCIFDYQNTIQLNRPSPQSPVQAFDCVFDNIIFEDCVGGYLYFINQSSEFVTSNTINRLILKRWKDCYGVVTNTNQTFNSIKYLEVDNCKFVREDVWLNQQAGDWGNVGIECVYRHGEYPEIKQQFVDLSKFGGRYVLPVNTSIAFSSTNPDAHYVVCGRNIASNDPDDYDCGFFTATVGQPISFSPSNNYAGALTTDTDGNLVFTQPQSYSGAGAIYSKCMTFAPKGSVVRASCILKDTGSITGQKYRIYILEVSCKTGLVIKEGTSSAVYPSADGASLTYQLGVAEDAMVIALLNASEAAMGSETTIEDFMIDITPQSLLSLPLEYIKYNGSSRDGNGNLLSVESDNYIMSSETNFNAKFKVDYVADPAWKWQDASGVNF